LLPHSNAKLQPPEGQTIHDGLVIHVALGDVWKSSLLELSGGQRSLVALSLVLALLLFKPAPLYILDEVDAALDLSHTQNIGTMIRKHFTQSQFVVVSLKEGMFNNANVIFRTKFVDGAWSCAPRPRSARAPARPPSRSPDCPRALCSPPRTRARRRVDGLAHSAQRVRPGRRGAGRKGQGAGGQEARSGPAGAHDGQLSATARRPLRWRIRRARRRVGRRVSDQSVSKQS
jgi:hypothetical protein